VRRLGRPSQGAQRVEGDERGEGEEGESDDTQRDPFPVRVVAAAGELPGDRGGGQDLNDAVQPEPDQRRRRRGGACGKGDDGLDGVSGDRRGDDQPDPAGQHVGASRPGRQAQNGHRAAVTGGTGRRRA
jgi:hypothetical protein